MVDMDNTLLDAGEVHWRAFRAAILKHTDLDIPTKAYYDEHFFGMNTKQKVEKIGLDPYTQHKVVEDKTKFFVEMAPSYLSGDLVLRQLIIDVRSTVGPFIVVTNSNKLVAHAALNAIDVFDVIDDLVTPDDVGTFKPDPKMYIMAHALSGTPLGECLAIEDSEPGTKSAIAAGLNVYRVNSLSETQQLLRAIAKAGGNDIIF